MSEVQTPEEQPTQEPQPGQEAEPTQEPQPEQEETQNEDHTHDVFSVPSELSPDVVEALEDAGFELSKEPEPKPYPEPPNVYESAPESEEAPPEEAS